MRLTRPPGDPDQFCVSFGLSSGSKPCRALEDIAERVGYICAAAVRGGEAYHFRCVPLHKRQMLTYCRVIHFTHLSSPFTRGEIHRDGPSAATLLSLCSLCSQGCSPDRETHQSDGTHQSPACLVHIRQSRSYFFPGPLTSQTSLFLDFRFSLFVFTARRSCSTFSLTHSLCYWLCRFFPSIG